MLALVDADFGDDSETLDQSALFSYSVGKRTHERASGHPCTLLEMGADVEQVHR